MTPEELEYVKTMKAITEQDACGKSGQVYMLAIVALELHELGEKLEKWRADDEPEAL